MVTSSLDNQIKLWDFEKEKCLKTYKGESLLLVHQQYMPYLSLGSNKKAVLSVMSTGV